MLELDRLSKRYGDTVALDELSLTVRPGGMFGFVGTNGAGKTTTMRIVMGVLAADSGTVRWRGAPVDEDSRRDFGYMPEERGLYPRMRVREQLVYLAQLRGLAEGAATKAADALLERLGLAARADDRVETLSLGNQQRVQLAAALTHDPELLVLDEPFASLDPVGVDALAEVLRERVDAGVVVVFSSHQLELVEQLCHEVGIIRAGQIVAAGPVDELRASGRSAQVRILVQAPPSWAEDPSLAAAGIRVVGVRREGDGLTETVLELSKPGDDQLVLDTARSARAVRVFAPERPSLADVFREAVGRAA